MRIRLPLVHGGLLVASMLTAFGACSSPTGTSDDGLPVDGQDGGSVQDAGVPSDGSTTVAPDDASLPVEPPPPPPGMARVRVKAVDGSPRSGIKVVFHAASGAPLETLTTDASGAVLRAVGQDEMATVLMRNLDAWPSTYSGTEAFTWVGVKVGDDLVTRESGARPPKTANLPVTLSVPAAMTDVFIRATYAGDPGFLRDACGAYTAGAIGGTNVPLNIAMSSDCSSAGTTALFAQAYGGSTQYWAVLKNVPVGVAASVSNWLPGVAGSVTTTNVPLEGGPSMIVTAWGVVGTGAAVFPAAFIASSTNLIGTPTNLQGHVPTNLFDAVERHARALTTGTGRSIVVRGPLPQPVYTFDFATAQPLIKTVVATPDAGGRPQVSFAWPAGAPADGITVMIRAGSQRWRFVLPGDRRAVTAPELPAELAEWALKGAIEQRVVMAYDVDVVADYDAFRNQSLDWAAWTRDDQSPRPILPRNATLRRVEAY